MRILIYSHPPYAQTGFGTVIRNLHSHLKEKHNVYIAPIVLNPGTPIRTEGATILSMPGGLTHSPKWIKYWVETLKIDLVIQHFDVWVLPEKWIKDIPCPVITYAPVDSTPLPLNFVESVEGAVLNIAMSKFAEEHFLAEKLPTKYIPHGVDLNIFKRSEQAKKDIGEDNFIVGIVATNGSIRKNIAGQLRAFQLFSQIAPNAKLYLHTQVAKSTPDSIDIGEYAKRLGIEDKLLITTPEDYAVGMPDQHVAYIYSCFDVLLQCTLGEGFGLPILEAQACGVPVIGTNFSAIPEIIGNGGITVKEGTPITFSYSLSSMFMPDPKAISQALCDIYNFPELRKHLSLNAVKNAETYSWDKIWPLWDEAIASCMADK